MRSDSPPEAAFDSPPEAAFDPLQPGPLPPIRRARAFRLYDVRGRRYIDLFRDGALLGHRGEGALTVMKSVLSQGLAVSLPSVWEDRLLGALTRRFPRCAEVRLYASPDRALGAVRCFLGEQGTVASPRDPALGGGPERAPAAFWRPFAPEVPARAVLPLLPVTVGGAPAPVCFEEAPPRSVPPSDGIPGFVLAGALRGFLAVTRRGPDLLSNPALERAVDAAPGWARTGPYIRALFPESDYAGVREEFLREGVLLAPRYPGPSVLPGECSPGEARRLAELFMRIPGG
jgi:hypothetical protein